MLQTNQTEYCFWNTMCHRDYWELSSLVSLHIVTCVNVVHMDQQIWVLLMHAYSTSHILSKLKSLPCHATNTKQTTTGPTHTKTFSPTCNKAVEHTPTNHRFWGHPTSFPGCPLISLLLNYNHFYLCFNPLLTCTFFTFHLSTSHSSPQ